jgi:oxygen-independent coproporphyrinogen-3 oxidase
VVPGGLGTLAPPMNPGRSQGRVDPRVRTLVPPRGTALYVHLPFCVEKCTYCDFFSVKAEGQDIGGTVDALLAEAAVRAPREPSTVFFGGGTPSLLGEGELTRLFDGLDSISGFRRSADEITVECNPESLSFDKASHLRQLGADRISIGFQSFDPRILRLFGRVHSAEDSLTAFDSARRADFRRLNVDVIYAAPEQALDAWLSELRQVIALAPEHVSAYALAYEHGTVLTHRLEVGEIERFHEDEELAFFLETRRTLALAGYAPYEISNFALPEEGCRHNCNYWRNGSYVGIGPSAVSHVGGTRMGNPRSIQEWSRGVARDGWALSWQEQLAPEQRLGETWWLGLRTAEGVLPADARATAGWSGPRDPAVELARELVDVGVLELDGARFRLSERGVPLADAVSKRFLEACGSGAPDSFARPADSRPAPTLAATS